MVAGTLPHTPHTPPDSNEEFESSRAGGGFGFPGGRLCRGSAAPGDVEGGARPPDPIWTALAGAGEAHGSANETEVSWSLGDIMSRVLLAHVPGPEPLGHSRMEAGTLHAVLGGNGLGGCEMVFDPGPHGLLGCSPQVAPSPSTRDPQGGMSRVQGSLRGVCAATHRPGPRQLWPGWGRPGTSPLARQPDDVMISRWPEPTPGRGWFEVCQPRSCFSQKPPLPCRGQACSDTSLLGRGLTFNLAPTHLPSSGTNIAGTFPGALHEQVAGLWACTQVLSWG